MDFHFHSNLNRLLLVRVFHLGRLRIPFTREWCKENGYFSKQPQGWKSLLTDKSVSFSWGQSRKRRARADRSRQGRRQEFFFTGCFQGAHGWNYFNENDQFPPFLTLEFNLGERQLIRFLYGILQKKYLQFESIGHSEYRGVLQGEAGSPFPIPLIPGLDPPESATDPRILFIVYFTLEHRKNNKAQVRTQIHHHESCTTITRGIDPRVMFIYISFMPERPKILKNK